MPCLWNLVTLYLFQLFVWKQMYCCSYHPTSDQYIKTQLFFCFLDSLSVVFITMQYCTILWLSLFICIITYTDCTLCFTKAVSMNIFVVFVFVYVDIYVRFIWISLWMQRKEIFCISWYLQSQCLKLEVKNSHQNFIAILDYSIAESFNYPFKRYNVRRRIFLCLLSVE